jgi:hypothetical protein
MNRDELRYIISDYCARYEIEITDEILEESLYAIKERIDAQEEYNYRCGIHSVDVDLILDNYFEDYFEEL